MPEGSNGLPIVIIHAQNSAPENIDEVSQMQSLARRVKALRAPRYGIGHIHSCWHSHIQLGVDVIGCGCAPT